MTHKTEIYIRDAQGNVLAIYEIKKNGNVDSLFTKEFVMYGSSRLGYVEERGALGRRGGKVAGGGMGFPLLPISPKAGATIINPFILPGSTTLTPVYSGNKQYKTLEQRSEAPTEASGLRLHYTTYQKTIIHFCCLINLPENQGSGA